MTVEDRCRTSLQPIPFYKEEHIMSTRNIPMFDPNCLDDIQYGVHIPGYHKKTGRNDVMSRDVWLEGVEDSFFMDCDGYGDGIRADGSIVETVRPSQASQLDPAVEFIVWFNK